MKKCVMMRDEQRLLVACFSEVAGVVGSDKPRHVAIHVHRTQKAAPRARATTSRATCTGPKKRKEK